MIDLDPSLTLFCRLHFLSPLQYNVLRHHDEELRGSKHLPQVAHDNKVRAEDGVQFLRDHYLHVPGSGYNKIGPRMELLVHHLNDYLLLVVPRPRRNSADGHRQSIPDTQTVER